MSESELRLDEHPVNGKSQEGELLELSGRWEDLHKESLAQETQLQQERFWHYCPVKDQLSSSVSR